MLIGHILALGWDGHFPWFRWAFQKPRSLRDQVLISYSFASDEAAVICVSLISPALCTGSPDPPGPAHVRLQISDDSRAPLCGPFVTHLLRAPVESNPSAALPVHRGPC
ncbi:hypothetical protein SKAU_G00189010 [Synaphobranchus kaupii]|uniref:Uncharacterized protein n=1 Tax=Synaphobranchus kaupii TaxID=118154 RepID=A0A9Q1IV05_SYNKA|nr:hypothetical protein SKAU_G00189010 [Synaphobranchus kaupii]